MEKGDTAKLKGYETYLSYSILEGIRVGKLPRLEKSTAVAGCLKWWESKPNN